MAALILVTFKQDNPFKIFENKTLIKLGQISYGLYVYHFLVLAIYMYAWQVIGRKIHIKLLPLAANNIFVEIIFVLCFYFILIKLSQWSFKYFESYFLNLKANLDKAKK